MPPQDFHQRAMQAREKHDWVGHMWDIISSPQYGSTVKVLHCSARWAHATKEEFALETFLLPTWLAHRQEYWADFIITVIQTTLSILPPSAMAQCITLCVRSTYQKSFCGEQDDDHFYHTPVSLIRYSPSWWHEKKSPWWTLNSCDTTRYEQRKRFCHSTRYSTW